MSASLVEFIGHQLEKGKTGTFKQREMDCQIGETLPTGIEVIGLSTSERPIGWRLNESATMRVDDQQFYTSLRGTIEKKDADLRKYRTNRGDMPIWLLIYSGASVSQSVRVSPSFVDWKFVCGFDKVFLFSAQDHRVLEVATLAR